MRGNFEKGKDRNKDLVEDERWKKKGGAHKIKQLEPDVCPDCHGLCTVDNIHPCSTCEGEGEVWD